MLTGRVPFEGDSTVSVALLHIQGEMVPPRKYEPMIPVSLEKIVLKCTQKKPEMRYRTVTELIADLKRALMTPNEDFVHMNTVNSNEYKAARQAEQNAAHYQEMLDRGTWDNGKPLTDADRDQLTTLIQRSGGKVKAASDYLDKVNAPVASSAKKVGGSGMSPCSW